MKISVIVTHCPDDMAFLERCVGSIRWQLGDGDELLVIDDVERKGPSAARNEGLLRARGDWLKFLDVDDLLVPGALAAIRAVASSSSSPVITGGQFVLHNGRLTGMRKADPEILALVKIANVALVSASAVRRADLQRVGGFDARIHFEEDWDLWLRLHAIYGDETFKAIAAPICFYSIDDELRAVKERTRDHTVEGLDVREYFRRRYGATPELAEAHG